MSLRTHLNSRWRQSGKKPKLLEDALEAPPLAFHLWEWFLQLNEERGSNGMGPNRITAQLMKDWCWKTGNVLELWERKAISRIDTKWMEAQNA